MITLADYYMDRDTLYGDELNVTLRANAALTVARANTMLAAASIAATVSSGWRPRAVNAQVVNASPTSKHLTCQAIDLADTDDLLDAWCLENLHVLEKIGLWLEHPSATPGWCHVQIVAPRSGRRVFEP